MYEIGKRIKMYRERSGLSQKDFAERIQNKNTTVSNWENGITRPDVDTLALICYALNVSADDLLGIRLSPNDMNEHEQRIIGEYRRKPEMQPAVNILLSVDAGE